MTASLRLQPLLRATPGIALAVVAAAGGAFALAHQAQEVSVIDGRYKAELETPTVETMRSTEWMAAIDTYVDERLVGRATLLATHARIVHAAFGDPVVNGVYVDGPGGQLLERPPALTMRTTLGDEAAALAEAVGPAPVLWVYAPRKEEIYADAVPASWPNGYPALKAGMLSAYAASGGVLDLTDLMAQRRAEGDDYFRTDHHWTPSSAKAAADAIGDRLLGDGAPIGTDNRSYAPREEGLPFFGSTGRLVTLGATAPDDVAVPVPLGGFVAEMCIDDECGLPTLDTQWLDKGSLYGNRYKAFLGGNHGFAVITNESPDASGRVLMLADSFGNAVATYLAERVSQLIVIDERTYDGVPIGELAAQFQPDAVVVLHNPQTLLTPSFNPAVWTEKPREAGAGDDVETYDTAVYEDVAVVTEAGLMLQRNHDQPLDDSLGDDARSLARAIDAVGVPQVWLYAPRKEEAFADLVPAEWGNPVDDKRERVLSLLGEGHEVVDLTQVLANPESRDANFYRTDHHWTPAAAQVALDAIVDGLADQGVTVPHDSRVWREVEGPFAFSGSEALQIPAGAPMVSEPMVYLEPDGGFRASMCADACDQPTLKEQWLSNPDPMTNRYYAFLGGGFRTMHLHNDSPHASGTIVMLKDSYTHPVALMLAERVTDLYLVDERGFDGRSVTDFLAEVDADAVVVMHNQVTLLSRAFNRDVWTDAAG